MIKRMIRRMIRRMIKSRLDTHFKSIESEPRRDGRIVTLKFSNGFTNEEREIPTSSHRYFPPNNYLSTIL